MPWQHYTYTLADRDISGGEEIVDIRNRGIRSAAMALKKSAVFLRQCLSIGHAVRFCG